MDINIIKKRLNTKFIGRNIISFDEVDSTNTQARFAAECGEISGTVITSEGQTAGRGHKGHSWISCYGEGILMSVLLHLEGIKSDILSVITLVSGLAVGEGLKKDAKVKTVLKWPNDVLIFGKKVCGILCERFVRNDKEYLVIGIGVNVNERGFPGDISHKATSLYIEKGEKLSREKILAQILNELEYWYDEFCSGRLSNIMEMYKSRCISIGRGVNFTKDNCKISGMIEDISSAGELIVKAQGKGFILNSFDTVDQGY